MILQIFSLALLLVYAVVMLRYWRSWQKIPSVQLDSKTPATFFSVLIPVRNEGQQIANLLQDLENQNYPKNCYEIIVIDDHSTDNTAEVVSDFKRQSRLQIELLFLASLSEKKHKKAAVEAGIAQAQGSWIICTDGDCRVPANWLASFNQLRHQSKAKLISGPVALFPTENWFEKLQALEFAGLIGVGAASIEQNAPTMCNGANLAYEREAFYAVNGFAGNDHIASGDDEFLLHKISKEFPGQIAFLNSKDGLVSTSPQANLWAFLQQRVRWASKWKHYDSSQSRWLALLVLGANAVVVGAFVAATICLWSWPLCFAALALKLIPDFILLKSVLELSDKKKLLWFLPLLQVVYLPYVLVTALLGFMGTYQWKGRKHSTA